MFRWLTVSFVLNAAFNGRNSAFAYLVFHLCLGGVARNKTRVARLASTAPHLQNTTSHNERGFCTARYLSE